MSTAVLLIISALMLGFSAGWIFGGLVWRWLDHRDARRNPHRR